MYARGLVRDTVVCGLNLGVAKLGLDKRGGFLSWRLKLENRPTLYVVCFTALMYSVFCT
jgi:hypothetical protein